MEEDDGGDLPFWYDHVAFACSFLIAVLFWYPISCLIVFTWNNIFGYFGEKSKLYEKNAVIFLLFLFIFIAIVLPTIGTYFVTIEKSTRPAISIDEFHRNVVVLGPNSEI